MRSIALALALVAAPAAAQFNVPGLPGTYGYGGFTVPGGFAFPIPTGLIAIGDSRTQNGGGLGGGTSQTVGYGGGGNLSGWYQTAIGNKTLLPLGGNFGVGSTTSLNLLDRYNNISNANSGNPASAATPAGTGVSADGNYNVSSDGVYSAVSSPANIVIMLEGVNDAGASGYYTSPLKSMQAQAAILDGLAAAGKVVILANELPFGGGSTTISQEFHAVTAGTFTATNTANFYDGRIFSEAAAQDNNGFPLTYVAGTPATGQYSVTTGGVYTFNTGAGTVPTGAYVTYSYGATASTGSYQRILHDWLSSNASVFIDFNSVNYGVPGALFNRGNTVSADVWAKLRDPASPVSAATALPGMYSNDGLRLHPSLLGGFRGAKAITAAFNSIYPAAVSVARTPTRNNWAMGKGNGTTGAYTFTLPPSMQFANGVPTQFRTNGVVVGAITTPCTTACAITGATVASGSLNAVTGVGTITFTSAVTTGLFMVAEQDFTNTVINGMLDTTVPVSPSLPGYQFAATSNLTTAIVCATACTAGTAGAGVFPGIPNSAVPTGWTLSGVGTNLKTALNNGSFSMDFAYVASCANGQPCVRMHLFGIVAGGDGIVITSSSYVPVRYTAGDRLRVGGVRTIAAGTNGWLYGLTSAEIDASMSSSTSNLRPTPTGNVAVVGEQTRAMTGTPTMPWGTAILVENGGTVGGGDGAMVQELISPPLDTTGFTDNGNVTFTKMLVTLETGKPISATIEYGLIHERARTD